ncbi:MAG: GH39 family glycosyl hydrolase [Ruminococcus sp.]
MIDSYPEYRGLEIHVTEYNTAYIPNAPIHDTNQNAAFLAQQLSRLGEDNESYSYWTFGDVFEEQGIPFTPFHGGFGLVANGCIPKPTFLFAFSKVKGEGGCVHLQG